MPTFLFDQTIFGPIISRRLGVSLGINLLPVNVKVCSFDCIYCECGWNPDKNGTAAILPKRDDVRSLLRHKLLEMKLAGSLPDVITFAGNGEPTMHPDFETIIDDTILLRDELSPKARIAVLSNSTMLHKPKVVSALKKIDDNILKLDSGVVSTIRLLNQPVGKFDLIKLMDHLKQFEGDLILQTMFLKGSFKGEFFDNTTDYEVDRLISLLKDIHPKAIMIYSIARDTPAENLQGITLRKLNSIAEKIRKETAITVQVSG
jgi:wyosine [tRNA(Phe)-imidazoG37] synthetase (radical SAM superfamily)